MVTRKFSSFGPMLTLRIKFGKPILVILPSFTSMRATWPVTRLSKSFMSYGDSSKKRYVRVGLLPPRATRTLGSVAMALGLGSSDAPSLGRKTV